MRDDASTGMPSRYHDIIGVGDPVAAQSRCATDFSGNVWFTGPRSIIGGGRSSCVLIVSFARALIEPISFSALHITTRPCSLRLVGDTVSTVKPSGVDVAFRLSNIVPGKINDRFPSIDQNIVGCGYPVARHSNDASACASTLCADGRMTNFGSAVCVADMVRLYFSWVVFENFRCLRIWNKKYLFSDRELWQDAGGYVGFWAGD